MGKFDWNEEKLRKAVEHSQNYQDVLRYLGIISNGNNNVTLKKKGIYIQDNTRIWTTVN
jgi:hypothetical protein